MTDISRVVDQIQGEDPTEVDELLPLVYNELRKLANHWMAQETPGQTMQATALVHEAYLRFAWSVRIKDRYAAAAVF